MATKFEVCDGTSDLWQDDVRIFDYEKYVLNLPEPVLLRVLRFLRYPDLITLKSTCPDLEDYCNLHLRLLDQEFPKRPFFQFERCAPERDIEEDENIEIMSERQHASMVYFPPSRSVYLFGGETLDTNDDLPAATFNDMWRLDTSTMKWNRVIITSAPYPSPKCHATLVVWEDKLLLYGGRAARPHGREVYYSELHYFHIKTGEWEYVSTGGSYNIGGHAAITTKKFMIVFGESVSFDEYETRLVVLDVKSRIFNTVTFDGQTVEEIEDFPNFDTKKTKLIQIREGLVLLTGELDMDYGSSVLMEFDPTFFINNQALLWKWKRVETIGRWWRPKNQGNENDDVENCALPNFNFYQIAAVQNSKIVRLVSLGKIRNEYQINRNVITEKYDTVQNLYREFCRQLKCHLEAEFQKREEIQNTCAVFQFQNVTCRIDGCFINEPIQRGRNAHRFKVSVKIGSDYSNPKTPSFDDFDKWELRVSIRAVVNQLHSKFYGIGRMDQLAPRVPMRNSAIKRLSIYVAEIDSNVEFDDFNELRWECQPIQYQSPVETRDFGLVAAHHDVIMHGGTVRFNETMRRMGQTTLMTPIARL